MRSDVAIPSMRSSPFLLLVVAGSVALLAIPLPSAGQTHATVSTGGAWSTYDTGREEIILPQPSPLVELRQDANDSAAAFLAFDHVAELAPVAGSRPLVVASAAPSEDRVFNTSGSAPTLSWPLTMAASVPVVLSGEPLWSPTPTGNATSQLVGNTSLTVVITPVQDPVGAEGVSFNWTVANWPWHSTGDLLGVEFLLTVVGGSAFQTCSASATPVSLTNCSGLALSQGTVLWNGSSSAVLASTVSGPLSVVAWPPTVWGGDGHSPVVVSGAYAVGPGVDRFLVAAATGGGAIESGSTFFYLAAPLVPALPGLLHGEPLIYGVAAAASAIAVGASWAGYRHRERRLLTEL